MVNKDNDMCDSNDKSDVPMNIINKGIPEKRIDAIRNRISLRFNRTAKIEFKDITNILFSRKFIITTLIACAACLGYYLFRQSFNNKVLNIVSAGFMLNNIPGFLFLFLIVISLLWYLIIPLLISGIYGISYVFKRNSDYTEEDGWQRGSINYRYRALFPFIFFLIIFISVFGYQLNYLYKIRAEMIHAYNESRAHSACMTIFGGVDIRLLQNKDHFTIPIWQVIGHPPEIDDYSEYLIDDVYNAMHTPDDNGNNYQPYNGYRFIYYKVIQKKYDQTNNEPSLAVCAYPVSSNEGNIMYYFVFTLKNGLQAFETTIEKASPPNEFIDPNDIDLKVWKNTRSTIYE